MDPVDRVVDLVGVRRANLVVVLCDVVEQASPARGTLAHADEGRRRQAALSVSAGAARFSRGKASASARSASRSARGAARRGLISTTTLPSDPPPAGGSSSPAPRRGPPPG